ncbi:MAG: class II aldolase/adducin family protein [Planctomycetota bacterium]
MDAHADALTKPAAVDAINALIQVGRMMYAQRYVCGRDGNMSVRLPDGCVLITRSCCHKGLLTRDDFVVLDAHGRQLAGAGRPSSESATHLAAYRLRPDVGAVVHAHPVECVALSVAGVDLDPPVVPEMVLSTGRVATVPYATPTTGDLERAVLEYLPHHDSMILARHGSLNLGPGLMDAFCRLENLVHAARTVLFARMLGSCQPLPEEELVALQSAHHGFVHGAST